MQTIADLFRIETANPNLMRAQMRALHNQVPLLYVILAINSTAVAVTYLGVAPERIAFLSSNRWDIAGAAAYGFAPVWVNRTGQPDEYPDLAPVRVIASLDGLLAR